MPSRAALAAAAAKESKKSNDEAFKKACDFCERKVKKLFKGSIVFEEDRISAQCKFSNKEIAYGRVLGRGGFGIVNEIKSLKIDDTLHRDNIDACKMLAANCQDCKSGDANYAIKQLSLECKCDAQKLVQAIMDLAIETYFLSSLSHPNIIKLLGIREGSIYNQGCFVIMDRLYETLEQRLIRLKKKGSSMFSRKSKGKRDELLLTKVSYGIDIASVLKYLHEMRVVYRDLKPENVGFDGKDCLKVFDFGLSKELHAADALDDDTYKLTGAAGSMRYMAPEVHKCENYTFSVDIYSFGMILWEIFAMEKPFSTYSTSMYSELVVNKGYRPKCDEKWSPGLKKVMGDCWKANKFGRPAASQVVEDLQDEKIKLK